MNFLKEKQAVLSVDLFIHRENTTEVSRPVLGKEWGTDGPSLAHTPPRAFRSQALSCVGQRSRWQHSPGPQHPSLLTLGVTLELSPHCVVG